MFFNGDVLRNSLLNRYFGKSFQQKRENVELGLSVPLPPVTHGPGAKILSRAGRTLHEVQSHLDREGASDLVVELVIKSVNSPSIFEEAVELGIALLEGGNPIIQKSMYSKLMGGDLSQAFFKVFYDKMKDAQQEIKSTVTVNTSDMAAKAHEDKEQGKELEKLSKKRGGKPNGIIITDELREELNQAAMATSQAYVGARTGSGEEVSSIILGPGSALEDMLAEKLERHRDREDQNALSAKVLVMQPILRFLQLLCENHNRDLQNLLRNQNNKTNYNLVSETLMFLDCICGSTTGGLGLLGLYINENNVSLINQTLETLTEYCQGPCHDNQNCIATHESNGLDIITALILNDINPLGKTRMDLVLELKNNASKLLLAIMESRGDSENAERILYNMNPKQLVDVSCRAFHQETLDEDDDGDDESCDGEDGVSPKEVGHNIYILCHQLAQHNKELAALLKPSENNSDPKINQALEYYASHTAQIEDRDLDWFPRLRAMSLAADEGEGEQIELRTLQAQLETTQQLVANLSQQLTELKDQQKLEDSVAVQDVAAENTSMVHMEESCSEFSECGVNRTQSRYSREANEPSSLVSVSGEMKERACDSLVMCIVTTLNQGLRNGGGIGDILRAPSSKEALFVARVVYDLLFFFIVIIIVLNLIFGVIIDTFADLRSEKQQKELILKNTCFICGLNRSAFDNKTVSFEEHFKCEHNMWHYLFFIVLVKVKDPTEFTGPESYVYAMVKVSKIV
ncbi:hypothetical protein J437_LFUL009249 [Ladona fulva]|uniref:Uncharacterized protein n=1 Tax=Ladona fulva TaxID=123851 RepID=A0A8K0KIB6_LADFU|nr:hypothetical protein J437_LFUL009249 [Ladona fulva]